MAVDEVMMSPRTKLVAWFVLGIVMALAPFLGTLPTVIGMVIAFNNPEQGGRETELLKESIDIGLLLTWAGISVCPAGIAIAVVSAVKLSRNKNS